MDEDHRLTSALLDVPDAYALFVLSSAAPSTRASFTAVVPLAALAP